MTLVTLLVFGLFLGLVVLGVRIAIALGATACLVILLYQQGTMGISSIFYSNISKFPLLAIPFFILAGFVMERSGVSARLVNLASLIVGPIPGGLAIVGVAVCVFFGGISGSGPADAAAIGAVLIPAMIAKGYDRNFAAGLIATAGSTAILIPPSIAFVVYGVITEVSVPALRGVDVAFQEGELVVLLGASGSGKSTLLNVLGGLDVPTSGTVRWRDHDLADPDEGQLTRYRRDHVGFVFQHYNLVPSLTARENVALAAEIARAPMTPEAALGLVGLSSRLDHFPSQLSGGEQQRVAIARAVVKRPEVLLCDEPTGALDAATGRLVLEALCKVNRELGTTTVIITHNATIADLADRVLVLRDGAVVEERTNAARRTPAELSW